MMNKTKQLSGHSFPISKEDSLKLPLLKNMRQEEILEILEQSQNEFIGVNESNLHSADIIAYKFEIEKLRFAIEQLKKFRENTFGKGVNVIKELEEQLKHLEK